jgi:aspartyl-tRNA synthetase
MGIDRIVQLLTNSDNIKDVVLFPLMKNKEDIKDNCQIVCVDTNN